MQVQVSLSIELSATANLTEMEEQIQIAGQQAMRQALKQAIRQREEQTPGCPHCGQPQRRLEGTVRRTIATTARTRGGSPAAFSLPGVLASLVSSQ